MSETETRPAAFAGDRAAQAARAAIKALWWGATGQLAQAITKPTSVRPDGFVPAAEPAPEGFVRKAWAEAFDKDARDVAAGLYPPMDEPTAGPVAAVRQAIDFLTDARAVEARRRRGGGTEAREDAPADGQAYPVYYRQNFHFQSGGWFTPDSARRYEAQVEALFAGTAAAMRRRALSLLAVAWRARDHRGLRVLDLACGAGAFLADLARAFPRARLTGCDLSAAYLAEAHRRTGLAVVQANAERLPFADASLDAVTCVYLFHELPPKIRPLVAAEIARVLKPGGLLAMADSIQPADEPRLGRLLEAFPAYFHEPYYESYCATDLAALFAEAGLTLRASDTAFLTKAMLFEKP